LQTVLFTTIQSEGKTVASKSMTGKDGGRKLAADAGRAKHKHGSEPQKERTVERGSARRAGSSKQRKG
jgi:hypothetical protein